MNLKNERLEIKTVSFVCPESKEGFEELKIDTQAAISGFLGKSAFDRQPVLNSQILTSTDKGSYILHKVRYGNETDDIVWAYLLVPKGINQPTPAIICLPGSYMTPNWGKEAVVGLAGPENVGDPEAYGKDLAEAGFITLCPDYPCAGERVPKSYKPYDTTVIDKKFPEWTRTGMSVWDVSRGIDFLETISDVAPERIGCMGWSQGGSTSLWAAAMDTRILVVVSVCGWSAFAQRDVRPLVASFNYPKLWEYIKRDRRLPFDMGHIAAKIAPRLFLNINGTNDAYVPNKLELKRTEYELEKLYELLGIKEQFETFYFEGIHGYTTEAARQTEKWFKKWLIHDIDKSK